VTMKSVILWGMATCSPMKLTDFSEERTASILTRTVIQAKNQQVSNSKQMSPNFYQTAWRHIPENSTTLFQTKF
jgi:hypothetical protein